jgi:hypothetical protein
LNGALQYGLIVAGAVVMSGTIGPVAAVVVDVVDARMRATAVAALTMVQNLVGLAGGPLVAGALSDALGLDAALSVMPLASLAAAGVFVFGARRYVEERASVGLESRRAGARFPPVVAR